VRNNAEILRGYQNLLKKRGVEIAWKKGLTLADGDPHIHAM